MSQIIAPPLTGVFGFIDAHEDFINDGAFFVEPWDVPAGNSSWGDIPALRHARGGNLSFCDGHVEPHRWRYPKKRQGPAQNAADLQDLRWLQARLPGP
ncbi:MAG: hypothetical protein HYY24_28585 [Verrucomicrobia bacterium]|nr:hypothetical protein [Verrucomicrobiota bacterium]